MLKFTIGLLLGISLTSVIAATDCKVILRDDAVITNVTLVGASIEVHDAKNVTVANVRMSKDGR